VCSSDLWCRLATGAATATAANGGRARPAPRRRRRWLAAAGRGLGAPAPAPEGRSEERRVGERVRARVVPRMSTKVGSERNIMCGRGERGEGGDARAPGAPAPPRRPRGADRPGREGPGAPGRFRLLFLGRLDPLKGLGRLFAALGRTDATLSVAGSGPHEVALRRAAAPLAGRVSFLGQVADAQKAILFATHDLLVLPSIRESFGIAVAEALAHGVPALVTRPTAWEHLEEAGAGRVVAPADLAEALASLERPELHEMGLRARDLAARTPAAPAVAERMIGLYERAGGYRAHRQARW